MSFTALKIKIMTRILMSPWMYEKSKRAFESNDYALRSYYLLVEAIFPEINDKESICYTMSFQ